MTLTEDKSYLLYLNSQDRISGSNNDSTFYINWDSFLPRKPEQYEVSFMFNSATGHFTDSGQSRAVLISVGTELPTGTTVKLYPLIKWTSECFYTAQFFELCCKKHSRFK